MKDNGKGNIGALVAALLFFFCRLVARCASLIYSAVSTDVLYQEGPLPGILLGLRSVMIWVSVLVAVVFLSFLKDRISAGAHLGLTWGFTLTCLADAVVAFVSDLLGGAFGDPVLIWMGIAVVVGTFLAESAFVWLVCWISRKAATPQRSVLWSSLVHMGGLLLLESVYLIQFLFEVDFAPYTSEVLSILRAFSGIALWQGIALFLAATLVCRLMGRKSRRAA